MPGGLLTLIDSSRYVPVHPKHPRGLIGTNRKWSIKIADLGAIVYTTTTGYHPPNEVTCLIPLRNITPNRWIRKVRPGTESAIDHLSLSP